MLFRLSPLPASLYNYYFLKQLSLALLLTAFMCAGTLYVHAQVDSSVQKAGSVINGLSNRLLRSTEAKYASLSGKLSRSNEKYLHRMQTQEEKLAKKLSRKDSSAGAKALSDSKEKYEKLRNGLKAAGAKTGAPSLDQYMPRLDSMQTLFKFMDKSGMKMPGVSADKLKEVQAISSQLNGLQAQLQNATDIKQFIKERKQLLTDQLGKFGMGDQLKQVNKQVYYYQQQVSEYKDLINDPDKLQEKALSLVRGSSVFKDFMSRNSQLAFLFGAPANSTPIAALAGLQTRASVQSQLSQRMSAAGGGGDPQQYLQQQVQQAQAEMDKLKDKINKLGGGGSDMVIPEFKPNNQKTKPFWKRIEYGVNIQSTKTTGLLPTTSDLAVTMGYKLTDKSTIGIGAGYKMGWGKNISHIHLSSQGLSLRSYVDIKLKGSIWISGGYESNYQTEFTRIEQLQNINAWQRSGLIGLTKKYKVAKKNGNLQLLWDFLSYSQLPRTQALKVRVGYTL